MTEALLKIRLLFGEERSFFCGDWEAQNHKSKGEKEKQKRIKNLWEVVKGDWSSWREWFETTSDQQGSTVEKEMEGALAGSYFLDFFFFLMNSILSRIPDTDKSNSHWQNTFQQCMCVTTIWSFYKVSQLCKHFYFAPLRTFFLLL